MSEQGGNEWERARAFELMKAALESGDFDALVLAWSRLGDALVNQLVSATYRQITPLHKELGAVHEELGAVHDERKEDAAGFEHRLGMLILLAQQGQAESGKIMARLGIAEAGIFATAHALTEHIEGRKEEG